MKREESVRFVTKSRWRAFISYRKKSDRDSWLAHMLQSELEGYKTPKRLKKHGVRPGVGNVYLDDTEISPGLPLTETLKEAISMSDHLIVICSPDSVPRPAAKGIDYIQEEIRMFRSKLQSNPDHRGHIFPVISAGSMDTLEKMKIHTPDNQLLAVDLRGWKQWRLFRNRFEFLRLVAPLIGCNYAELNDRERRRARQRQIILGLATTVFLITSIVALFGWREANIQKNIANTRLQDVLAVGRLVFTVADQELKQVHGTADMRKKLTAAAGEIVERLVTEEEAVGDVTILRVRALGHTAAGDEAWAIGDMEVAVKEYEAALNLDEKLLDLDPKGVERYSDLAVSHGKLARLAAIAGDLDALEQHASQAKHYAEKAFEREPSVASRVHALAVAYGQLALHAVMMSDCGAGRRYLAERMVLTVRAAQLETNDPRILSSIASTYTDLAGLELEAGNPQSASEYAATAIEQFTMLQKRFPENPDMLRGMYVGYAALGEAATELGQLEEAISSLSRARVLAEDQLAKQPTDKETQTRLALIEFQVFRIELRSERQTMAARAIQRACTLAGNSQDPRLRSLQKLCAQSRGEVLSRKKR